MAEWSISEVDVQNPIPVRPGMQIEGISNDSIYHLASRCIARWPAQKNWRIADVGGGKGDFAKILLATFEKVTVLECDRYEAPAGISYIPCDLNQSWPVPSCSFDAVVSLEVIEHLENPRHFARELSRVLKKDGYGFISTPNQLSLASKICLVFRDQFQHFQDSCYPGHITALVPQDVRRIFEEVGLVVDCTHFTDSGRIPFTSLQWQMLPFLRGKWFSDNVGFSFRS
jgi:2-polyprenyl-3-methyl-5-hydroxy-6-metoxy-1,4-benzoquinol methylase